MSPESPPMPAPPQAASPGASHGSAWCSPRAWAFLLAATAVLLAVDLASKSLAFRFVADTAVTIRREDALAGGPLARLVPDHKPVVVLPRLLEFTLVLNPGAVFGLGAGQRGTFIIF